MGLGTISLPDANRRWPIKRENDVFFPMVILVADFEIKLLYGTQL